MPQGRPILVTGAHRSGTGWVGRMLAGSPSPRVAYLWEPFSLLHRPGILDLRFEHWFPYVCRENERAFIGPIEEMLALRYRPLAELRAVRSPKDLGRLGRDWTRMTSDRRAGARPLLKDPIAVFSAEWLCDRLGMDVVVLVRHPAAFAYSVVRRGLRHPFRHFLDQPLLMRDVLGPYEEEIRRFAEIDQPLLDQAILLWKLIHHAALGYRERRGDWMFLRLEDLARAPEERFRDLYDRLDLGWDDGVRRTVLEHSAASNPAEASDMAGIRRDSRASVVVWKERLSAADVRRVRDGLGGIAEAFYADEDW